MFVVSGNDSFDDGDSYSKHSNRGRRRKKAGNIAYGGHGETWKKSKPKERMGTNPPNYFVGDVDYMVIFVVCGVWIQGITSC